MRASRFVLVGALVTLSLLVPATAIAQEEAHPTFVAEMTGFEEVPGAATLAKGFAGIQVSADGTRVYYAIVLTDSSTPLNAAHLHFGARGEAGPIFVNLCTAQSTPCVTEGTVAEGSFTAADFIGPFLNDGLNRLIDEARRGMVYVNVHSTKFPGGEARGQLADVGGMQQQPEPAMEEPPPDETPSE